jgi:hypothetical protein
MRSTSLIVMVFVIDDEQLVNAEMLSEKFIRAGDWIFTEFLFVDCLDLRARLKRVGDFLFGVARFDDVAGQQADQFSFFVHYRKRAETEFLLFDEFQYVADELVGRDFDRLLNQAVNVIFHAADFGKLLPLGHVVMNQPQPAVERHGDGHAGFRHGIHVRRDDRNVKLQSLGNRGVELRVAREDFRVKRRERDVVKGQTEAGVSRKEGIRLLVKPGIETVRIFDCCHVR